MTLEEEGPGYAPDWEWGRVLEWRLPRASDLSNSAWRARDCRCRLFLVDAVDRFLAHTEEERGHDDEVEVESGVDANKEAQVVFVGVALERD